MAIAPLWVSTEHCYTALMQADDMCSFFIAFKNNKQSAGLRQHRQQYLQLFMRISTAYQHG